VIPKAPVGVAATRTLTGYYDNYFPKGTDLGVHDENTLDAVAYTLNNWPRKTLGWKTPAEALEEVLS